MRISLRLSASALLGVLAAWGCTYGHQEAQSGPYQPLVFPGEARLGATAMMVIDSNQFQIGDQLERYDLYKERVRIVVEGNASSADADVQDVFAIETGRATKDAEMRAGSWVMVALFDLPDASAGLFSGGYPQHAKLHLYVDDNQNVPALEGTIWIIGTGGQPTEMNAGGLPVSITDSLAPVNMVRLRARDAGAQGFEASWAHIGSIAAEVRFTTPCLSAPHVITGSEAIGSSAFLSAPVAVSGSEQATQLTMVRPRGLQLNAAGITDPTRLGQGPILDVTFVRDKETGCDGPLSGYFEIRNLRVADYDGIPLLTDASPSDSSEFFDLYYVDPEGSR